MKLFAVFGIFLLVSGCSINMGVIGRYSSSKGPNNIELRNDSTFIYEYRAFHLYQYSIGKWKMLKRNLVTLTSEVKSTVVPITVKNVGNQLVSNILLIDLKINPNKNLSYYKCGIYINDSLYIVKRCDSIASLAINVPINNIYFHFTKEPVLTTTTAIAPPVFTIKYFTKISRGNKLAIEVHFDDSYFYYKSFNGDTVRINGHHIKMYNIYNNKWEKVRKVSDGANIFSHFSNKM